VVLVAVVVAAGLVKTLKTPALRVVAPAASKCRPAPARLRWQLT